MRIKNLYCFFCFVFSLIPITAEGQKVAKKHKYAPDETIVILVGKINPTFDESLFPHLKFYYLTNVIFEQSKTEKRHGGKSGTITTYKGEPDFIVRWGSKKHIGDKEMIHALLIDHTGIVAYQNSYSKHLLKNTPGEEFEWSILNKPRKLPNKETLEEYMQGFITKGKKASVDKKKSYTEGVEPSYKDWDDGSIDGMEFPDFKVKTSDDKEMLIKEILANKPGLILFTGIDDAANYGSNKESGEKLKTEGAKKMSGKEFLSAMKSGVQSDFFPMPLLWHVENSLYNYYPSRK